MPHADVYPAWRVERAQAAWWLRLQAAVVQTRPHFWALAAYLAAQAYLIPLRPLGPSWAVWPRLADGAMMLMTAAAVLWLPSVRAVPSAHRRIITPLLVWLGLCGTSFLVVTLLLPRLGGDEHPSDKALIWGLYQFARLAQFTLLFLSAAIVPLSPPRTRGLARLTAAVLLFHCVAVGLTYFGIVRHEWLVAHLPASPDVAGPWASFGATGDSGLGTISYNHAYVACQLLLLLVVRLSLSNCQFSVTNVGLVVLTLFAIFLSGSRAGFGGMLMLLGAGLLPQWIYLGHARPLLAAMTGGALLAGMLSVAPNLQFMTKVAARLEDQGAILSRQLTVLEGFQADNLSGRTEIWSKHLMTLSEQPWRWAIGGGFGSAIATGEQAHNLALNIVDELGLIGIAVGAWLMLRILSTLRRCESHGKPLFWGSLALLLTSLTQETFYPVPALGHFVGLYLVAVAIALRVATDRSAVSYVRGVAPR